MQVEIDLRKFTETFFKKLGSELIWEGSILKVENVPSKFEAFVGKKGPYRLVFQEGLKDENSEILSKGGYFVNAMSNFLENKNKSSLIKLNFDLKPIQEINSRFTFLNSEIEKVDIKLEYDYFVRFTFSNSLQYLNDTEHETITIYIYDGRAINFDISKYKYSDGNKEDIKIGDLKNDFEIAQKKLKERINGKVLRITNILSQELDKELKRIVSHYNQQIKEVGIYIIDKEEQIKALEESYKKAKDNEKEKIIRKIEKLKKDLLSVNYEEKKKEIEKEKEFFLADERHKYGLNVSNSLINTSVIYYPKFKFIVNLKSKDGDGKVELYYDPLQKHMPPVKCDYTGKPIYKIYICAAGRICSENELVECIESGKLYCKSVMDIKCAHCHKPVYKKYAEMCPITKKYYAKSYMKTDAITGKRIYMGLLQYCPASGTYTTKERFKSCPVCNTSVSPLGLKKGFSEGRVIEYCKLCGGKSRIR